MGHCGDLYQGIVAAEWVSKSARRSLICLLFGSWFIEGAKKKSDSVLTLNGLAQQQTSHQKKATAYAHWPLMSATENTAEIVQLARASVLLEELHCSLAYRLSAAAVEPSKTGAEHCQSTPYTYLFSCRGCRQAEDGTVNFSLL